MNYEFQKSDLFTARGLVYWAKAAAVEKGLVEGDGFLVLDDDMWVIGNTRDEVFFKAQDIRDEAFLAERDYCWDVTASLEKRRLFAEYHAKFNVGYNAAFKYHCTYGHGSELEPSYEIHPAYR